MDHTGCCHEGKSCMQPKVTPDDSFPAAGAKDVGESALDAHMRGIAAEFERLGEVIRKLEAQNAQLTSHMSDVSCIISDVVSDLKSPGVPEARVAKHDGLAAVAPVTRSDVQPSPQRPARQLLPVRVQQALQDQDDGMLESPSESLNAGDPPKPASGMKTGVTSEVEEIKDEGDEGDEPFKKKVRRFPSEMVQSSSLAPLSRSEKIAHRCVELLPPIVIVLNATTLGLSTDICVNCEIWQITEIIFTIFYALEFAIKLKLYGCYGYFRGRLWYWNVFDCFLLMLSMTELSITYGLKFARGNSTDSQDATGNLVMLKIFRLARLMRTIRALQFEMFHELRLMLMGIINGMSVLFWAIVLLFLLIYVIAIFMTNLLRETLVEFRSLPSSMFTLFRCFTEGCAAYNGTPLAESLRLSVGDFGGAFMMCYAAVMMLVTVGIFNMIMARFLETAVTAAVRRKQRELSECASETEKDLKRIIAQLCDDDSVVKHHGQKFSTGANRFFRHHMFDFFCTEDDFDNMVRQGVQISKEQFHDWLGVPAFLDVLERADIDTSTKFDLFDILDADMGGALADETARLVIYKA
eukprot:TRINITY_DN11609_c0_g1_i2.p1 TRINITY_DN11609_c0_g1~~TRINITY_DN11609_c0_g1_i2.p1  ORF type:complete len:587 (+),score=79.27 TRINITY_DN11609_c0_g1_i2:24-1763(+)